MLARQAMAETSGDRQSGTEAARAARIGSARSDFISSLGRRVHELKTSLAGLEQDPGSTRHRDDLRRRVHALSAGARLLRFSAMAAALRETERILERVATAGAIEKQELLAISELFESLPTLAWNEPTEEQRATERPPASTPIGEQGPIPPTVLVIGPAGLADAITSSIDRAGDADVECERTDSAATGLELARALAPDVAVVDVDLGGTRDLMEKLARDPLTEPMPLIAVGTWSTPEDGAKWIALGAARALSKPVSPHELRKACFQLTAGRNEPLYHVPIGQTTVEELTARIIEEVKRGLPNALVQGKATPIQLGDGSDILAAVWGAVARVRDLIIIKSNGAVRFSAQGPEGALPFAPWWGESPTGPARGGGRGGDPQAASDQPVDGRTVVVADDDPAVTWFVGGVLRAAGAKVREAHDGDKALELCLRLQPDLVISDVLMPGRDGFALCRALKRDIGLRDVPVILLSWKEDLLQRLRDLGADADGYLRKEASAAAILQRVQEVLRPKARIEARLRSEGEVRGRLDGVTPRSLLYAIARLRPDARLAVRDASFLYEVELRGGAPKSATRTTSNGSFQRGKEVFAALLGVRAGRFVASRATGPVRGTLEGDLDAQMERPLAHARAALKLLGGTRLLEVHRVQVAVDRVLAYLAATPEPARSLVHRLADGASPRGLILGGEVAPADLEEVLCDLAAHGAVLGIHGAGAADLLGPALEQELLTTRSGSIPSDRPSQEIKLIVVERSSTRVEGATTTPTPPLGSSSVGPDVTLPSTPLLGSASSSAEVDAIATPAPDPALGFSAPSPATPGTVGGAPSSLEAAVIRQISDQTPAPVAPATRGTAGEPIVDTSELKTRSLAATVASDPPAQFIPSLPPDAVVPASVSEDRIRTSELATTAVTVTEAVRVPVESLPVTTRPGPTKSVQSRGSVALPIVLVALLFGSALVLYLVRFAPGAPDVAVVTPPLPPALPVTASPTAAPSAATSPPPTVDFPSSANEAASAPVVPLEAGAGSSAVAPAGEDLPLPQGAVIPAGQGLLDIETGGRESIFVDGVELGRGPFLRLTIAAGTHDVRLRAHGDESIKFTVVRAARRTRLTFAAAFTR